MQGGGESFTHIYIVAAIPVIQRWTEKGEEAEEDGSSSPAKEHQEVDAEAQTEDLEIAWEMLEVSRVIYEKDEASKV